MDDSIVFRTWETVYVWRNVIKKGERLNCIIFRTCFTSRSHVAPLNVLNARTVPYSLTLSLPGEQHVNYQEGQEVKADSQIRRRDTHLTAWFTLNKLNAAAK